MAPGTLSSEMTWRDRLGTLRVRLGIGRMNYRVRPGLYALGRPTAESPVLVSANFKLSVDHLRSAVRGTGRLDPRPGYPRHQCLVRGGKGPVRHRRSGSPGGIGRPVGARLAQEARAAAAGRSGRRGSRGQTADGIPRGLRAGARGGHSSLSGCADDSHRRDEASPVRMAGSRHLDPCRSHHRSQVPLVAAAAVSLLSVLAARGTSLAGAALHRHGRSGGSHSSRFLRAARSARCSCRGCPGVPSR